jgi:hypothetical protein
MPENPLAPADDDSIKDAEAARDDLAAALAGAGITLPSLELDAPTCFGYTVTPLISLGRCNIATARKLAAALRGGAR